MVQEKLTVNTEELQALTGFGRDHVKRLIREGKLPNVGNAKRFLVPRSAVVNYLESAGAK